MSDQEQAVVAVVRDREAAIGRGDADAAVAPLADGAVMYTLAPPLSQDPAAARDADALRAWLATWEGGVGIELRDPTVHVDGDLAVLWGLATMAGTKKDGAGPDGDGLWYRMTIVLARHAGAWRIIHEHDSVPFLMDGSFKAAIDLKP